MYFLFENVLICMTCAASFAASFIDIDVFKHFKYIRMKNQRMVCQNHLLEMDCKFVSVKFDKSYN